MKLDVNMFMIKKKKWETSRIKCKKCECCLKYTNVKEDLVEWFDENLQKRFVVTYKFFNHDLNIFILLPWKGLYPYKCMGNETSLPAREMLTAN